MNRNDVLNFVTVQANNENLDDYTRLCYQRVGDLIVEDRKIQDDDSADLFAEMTAGLVTNDTEWIYDFLPRRDEREWRDVEQFGRWIIASSSSQGGNSTRSRARIA